MNKVTTESLSIDLLKEKFPAYRWNDASNRSVDQIRFIVANLCHNNNEIAVLIKKNGTNKKIFDDISVNELKSVKITKQINTIIFNKDNYIYFSKNSEHLISTINKNLFGNMVCISCNDDENNIETFWTCSKCTTNMCIGCLKESMLISDGYFNCPVCRIPVEDEYEITIGELKSMTDDFDL